MLFSLDTLYSESSALVFQFLFVFYSQKAIILFWASFFFFFAFCFGYLVCFSLLNE